MISNATSLVSQLPLHCLRRRPSSLNPERETEEEQDCFVRPSVWPLSDAAALLFRGHLISSSVALATTAENGEGYILRRR